MKTRARSAVAAEFGHGAPTEGNYATGYGNGRKRPLQRVRRDLSSNGYGTAVVNEHASGATRELIGVTVQLVEPGLNHYHWDVQVPAVQDVPTHLATLPTKWLDMIEIITEVNDD
jgi:hypothetical protein